ncbi:MAG: hypothetical protein ACYDHT_01805 [Solirubrobacteraceae bacterium]
MFALAAVFAGAAAAANPEYFEETKAKTIVKLAPEKKVAFTSKGVASKLEGGVVIECASDAAKGTIKGPTHTEKVKITYSSCNAPSITSSCQKAPTKPGVIITESLVADLKEASEKVGGALSVVNEFNPEKAGKPFAKFTCGPKKELTVIVTGHIFAEQGPVNAAPSTTGFTINREKAKEEGFGCSKQQFLFLNGAGACQHLETGAGVSWNISEDTTTTKTKLELKA